jgi:addiction module HigA family antidote
MPMKNPAHPGRLLADDLEALGLTVAKAAKGLDVTRQQLYNVINAKSGITAEMAVRLEQAIGGTADGWLGMQQAYDLAQIRLRKNKVKLKRLVPKVPLAAE